MASLIDNRAALTAMVSVITAFTSAVVVSTSTIATSIASQASADTGLTTQESAICTAVSSAIGSAQPSSSIHNLPNPIDTRTLYAAMTSVLTALTSATGVSTGNLATQLSSLITADTGLTNQEKGLVTLFTSAVGNTQPSSSAHSQV
jgi:prophage DNA circulation protein